MQKKLIAALIAGALAAPVLAQNVAVINSKPIPQARLDELITQFKDQAKTMLYFYLGYIYIYLVKYSFTFSFITISSWNT